MNDDEEEERRTGGLSFLLTIVASTLQHWNQRCSNNIMRLYTAKEWMSILENIIEWCWIV